ncbi:MAG: CatA-like O-acetyltransferase [Terracidiphilus sp.]
MHNPLENSRQKINPHTWERAATFDFFRAFTEPFHGVCLRVDCTATHRYAKDHGLSVFLSLVHRALAAVQQTENLRTRIIDGEVWLYQHIHGSSVVARSNGTFGFAYYSFHPGLDAFVQHAVPEMERVRQRNDLELNPAQNLIHFSVLPWFDFSSISHARNFVHDDSVPRITFGKITEAEGRRTMPVSIHAHHALADGLHVAQFVEHFQNFLNAPESRPGEN